MRFRDRAHAGRELADRLDSYAGRENLLVLGLPRGGVPVAFEVARELDAPLDVFVVRKLAVRAQGPERLVVAVPVAAADACEKVRAEVDEVVCPLTPEPFAAIGLWYDDFAPTSDEEVRELL